VSILTRERDCIGELSLGIGASQERKADGSKRGCVAATVITRFVLLALEPSVGTQSGS